VLWALRVIFLTFSAAAAGEAVLLFWIEADIVVLVLVLLSCLDLVLSIEKICEMFQFFMFVFMFVNMKWRTRATQ
jgi:hypothetical protein